MAMTSPTNLAAVDNRKTERAARAAARKASREAAAQHNARVLAEREAARRAVEAHEAIWGVDGYECA